MSSTKTQCRTCGTVIDQRADGQGAIDDGLFVTWDESPCDLCKRVFKGKPRNLRYGSCRSDELRAVRVESGRAELLVCRDCVPWAFVEVLEGHPRRPV